MSSGATHTLNFVQFFGSVMLESYIVELTWNEPKL